MKRHHPTTGLPHKFLYRYRRPYTRLRGPNLPHDRMAYLESYGGKTPKALLLRALDNL